MNEFLCINQYSVAIYLNNLVRNFRCWWQFFKIYLKT